MDGIIGSPVLSGGIHWSLLRHQSWHHDEGFRVQFSLSGKMNLRDAVRIVKDGLAGNEIEWISPRGHSWILDVTAFLRWLEEHSEQSAEHDDYLKRLEWLSGVVPVEPEIDQESRHNGEVDTYLRFNIYREEYQVSTQTRVFLSHKGADKPMVERFYATLKLLGFDPWLDKEAMAGGAELHRGLRDGFRASCAVVFFITPNFRDEKYLRNEINYAVEEKTDKGTRFAIVTLVFSDDRGIKGVVPDLLGTYVWKEPADELEALQEIIRALPLGLGPPTWRPGV